MAVRGSSQVLLGFLVGLQLFLHTSAYYRFRQKIPNGESVPHPCLSNELWDGVGHKNAGGGGERNPFGLDFAANGKVYNVALCRKDSDGDGRTNGEELGDPDCQWQEGGTPRTSATGHPGVCEPVGSARCQGKNDWLDCKGFVCNGTKGRDVRHIDLVFDRTKVPATETNYYCQSFDLPYDRDYHIVADVPVLINKNVIHHMLLYGCPNAQDPIVESFRTPGPCGMLAQSACPHTIGGWTVGNVGDCFDGIDAATRIGNTTYRKVILEVHWNNPFRSTNEYDASGMRLYLTPHLRKHDLGVVTFGQARLNLPPGLSSYEETSKCSSGCTRSQLDEPIYVVSAGMHMHYLGIAASLHLYRNGRLIKTLADDKHFRYDSPVDHNHSPSVEVLPGDEFAVRCAYNSSDKTKFVYYGDATADEMCYAYVTYYPKKNFNHCIHFGGTELCNADEIPVVAGCNTMTDDYWFKLVHLNETCDNTGKVCRQACKDLLTKNPDPCYVGDAKAYTEFFLPYEEAGDKVVLASRSCDAEIYNELTNTAPGGYSVQGTCFSILLITVSFVLF